jgi:CRISPR-associated protein Cas6
MYWQEENSKEAFEVPEDIIDLHLQIRCSRLPVDHAWHLSEAIKQALPWFVQEPQAGLHLVHCADSGNGWERPQGADAMLQLSRRTPLVLRLPKARIEDARSLLGKTLDIGGYSMEIKAFKPRPLAMTQFLYARYVAFEPDIDEEQFIQRAVAALQQMGTGFKKILCGKTALFANPEGAIQTRSLMVANLSYPDAITLQEQGLGNHRTLGCGLFLAQKSF